MNTESNAANEEPVQSEKLPANESPSNQARSAPPSWMGKPGPHRWLIVGIAFLIVMAGGLAVFLTRGVSSFENGSGAGRPVPAPTGAVDASASGSSSGEAGHPRPGDITLTLSPSQLENAQIKIEAAVEQTGSAAPASGGQRTTGTVQSNAYKEVSITPIAGGIVRQVDAEIGAHVEKGAALVSIFSSELAEAQATYMRGLAEVEEHHQHHKRTIELVEIGAASREELEQVTSTYRGAQANLSSARQRLIALGMSVPQIDALQGQSDVKALITVLAPSSGTVINRSVNPGEIVDKGKELLRIADLSTVWIIGQIYENDFGTIHVGMPAVATTPAYPDRSFTGRISYIDPRVDPATRTAQVRIEVTNPGAALKLGMFVDVNLNGGGARPNSGRAVLVPGTAIQNIGARQVVFIAANEPGKFVQRVVSTASGPNGLAAIYDGLSAGERVVTDGSFLLRAESLKLNPTQAQAPAPPPSAPPNGPARLDKSTPSVQSVTVKITAKGFEPDQFKLRLGIPARITFLRQVEVTCATEVTVPDYGIKRELPFNVPVALELTPGKKGDIPFSCGMNMIHGKMIVR